MTIQLLPMSDWHLQMCLLLESHDCIVNYSAQLTHTFQQLQYADAVRNQQKHISHSSSNSFLQQTALESCLKNKNSQY